MFTLGCNNLTVSTDYHPLLGIFSNKELSNISNPHICNLKKKTTIYHFKIQYNPGNDITDQMHVLETLNNQLLIIQPKTKSVKLLLPNQLNMTYIKTINKKNQCYQNHPQNIFFKWYVPIVLQYRDIPI